MNTRLLRMARRFKRGRRQWVLPGYCHAVTYIPNGFTPDGFWGATLSWPSVTHNGMLCRKGINWRPNHCAVKSAIRQLLRSVTA